MDVLSLLTHRNIVGYYNNYVDVDVMYIEMEYANGGTLGDLINAQGETPFSEVCCRAKQRPAYVTKGSPWLCRLYNLFQKFNSNNFPDYTALFFVKKRNIFIT